MMVVDILFIAKKGDKNMKVYTVYGFINNGLVETMEVVQSYKRRIYAIKKIEEMQRNGVYDRLTLWVEDSESGVCTCIAKAWKKDEV